MSDCPFCGHDPYHYVDNGVGMEAVAVTCCEIGALYFGSTESETVTIGHNDLYNLADKLRASNAAVNFTAGYDTAQLEGRTLAEVAEAAQAYIDSEMNVIGADYTGDQDKLEDAMGVAVLARERLQNLLDHLRSTGHD